MGTGKIGNLWRARTHRRRIALVTTLGLAAVVGALVFPFAALSHDASDYFIFARAEIGADVAEATCDGASDNDKQAEISGSTNVIHGRVHSNADYHAGGSSNVFHGAVTFGSANGDCAGFAGGNTYLAGAPTDLNGSDPPNVNDGWPGDLSTYMNADTVTFGSSISQILPGTVNCDVGNLVDNVDTEVDESNDGDVVCNGPGNKPIKLAAQEQNMDITMVAHSPIQISGSDAVLRPQVHGILAWTDYQDKVALTLAGSKLSVPKSAILFSSRGGIDTSGSTDADLCIQLIGQGHIRVPGSDSVFGPGSAACTDTPPQLPNITVSKVGNGTIDPGPGQNAQFTIEIHNDGPGAATNVQFTTPDVLPNAGLTWSIANQGLLPTPTGGQACSIANDQLTCSILSLADDATYRVVVTSPTANAQCGDKPNQVTVQAGNEAPGQTGDNTDSDTIVIRCPGNIVVQKVVVPNTDQTEFEFDTSYGPNFSLGHGDSNNSGPLMPGTYSVAELVPAGWDLDNVNCDDNSPRNAIQLGSGETVTCVFTNTKRGKIIVDKNTVPANDPQSFDFSLTGGPDAVNQGFSLTHAATPHDSGLIKPGGYSVSETVPAGWMLTGSTCSDGSAPGAIALAAGETVTCTFTNTKAAKIIVVKQTDPDGDPQSFSFNASYDADGFSLTDGQQNDSGPLTAGQYSVSENVPAGWDLESATCSDNSPVGAIVLSAGETVTCTFTNEKDAKIIVEKQTNPDGSTQVFTFNASYDNDGFSLTDGQQNNSGDLDPGQYSVSENVPAGWTVDNVNCSDSSPRNAIVLAAGETVTCVFTNTIQPGKIIVVKQTNPDGDPQSFSFNASYDNDGFSLTDGQSNDSGPLTPGQYSVSENVPAGWDLESATCNDGSPVNAIVVAANETVTCTFTNEKDANIVVVKQTDPDGDPQVFTFTASYDADGFSLSDGQQNDSGDLDPGTYSVSENLPAGWDLESATCSDQSAVGAISLQAGETVTCTFTNEKDARIVVIKQTNPDGDPQTFNFTASYDANGFSLTDGQSNNSGDLDPGTYSVSEVVPAGWDLTSATCSDQSLPSAISLQAGEVVTCTFNNEKDSRIVVIKQTNPDGDPQSFTFTASYDADGFALSDGQQNNSGDLDPGTYSVSEVVPAGWDLTSATCSDQSLPSAISLQAGEVVTCTFTNEKDAKIIVVKQTNPDADPTLFTFAASYDADGFVLSDGQQNDSGDLDPGTYSVSETVPAGWDLQSATCSDQSPVAAISLQAGETVTCTFTNVKDAFIIVEKQTDPAGDPQVFTFNASYDNDGFSLSDNQQNDSGDLDPGTYSVSENVPAGWALESAICSDQSPVNAISLQAGETVTCVFTNEKDAKIIVEKQTDPANDPTEFDFTASYDQNGFSLSDNEQNDSGDLDPGTYSVAEVVPQGWDLISATCDDQSSPASISLQAGEVVTCTFTNEKDSKIIIEKQTLPAGDTQSFHFDADYDEGGFNLIDNQQNDSGDLDPGQYTVSEDVPEGWELTDVECDAEVGFEGSAVFIGLGAGDVVTCVFTNTKLGSIIVEKQTVPDGAQATFNYTGDAAGTIGDGGQIVVDELLPGTYTSTEGAAPGWNLTSIICNDANSTGALGTRTATFRLEAGEVVKCTFTNSEIPVVLGQGALDVQKSANPTSVKEPGGPVEFTVTITNTSNVVVTVDNVVDSVFGDLDDDGGNGCFDVPIILNPGQKATCTFTKQITGPGGSAHINIVRVEGHDPAGNRLTDTDDARVDITPRLIDLVIVKTATSPTPLNGIVNYTMTVTNKGPDPATNVQLADPAPNGIVYLTANPSQGTCNVAPALITCSLGTINPGQTVTIGVTARATLVGTHTNIATVTGGGGRETNPADNVDDAVTVVPAPIRPPTVKPQPPAPVCLTLTVSPKMIKADGKPDTVRVRVTAGKKRMKGTKVSIFGAGVRKTGRSNGQGMAVIRINPRRAGLITITALETNQRVCGPKRIGVVGVFLPPLTG